jgi:hypothetical protein
VGPDGPARPRRVSRVPRRAGETGLVQGAAGLTMMSLPFNVYPSLEIAGV